MNVKTWLNDHMISAEAYDADKLIDSFINEMERGLAGEGSSLPMIAAFVAADGNLESRKSVAVIDAGGMNLRVCLARFSESGTLELSHFTKQLMPGREWEYNTAAEF